MLIHQCLPKQWDFQHSYGWFPVWGLKMRYLKKPLAIINHRPVNIALWTHKFVAKPSYSQNTVQSPSELIVKEERNKAEHPTWFLLALPLVYSNSLCYHKLQEINKITSMIWSQQSWTSNCSIEINSAVVFPSRMNILECTRLKTIASTWHIDTHTVHGSKSMFVIYIYTCTQFHMLNIILHQLPCSSMFWDECVRYTT